MSKTKPKYTLKFHKDGKYNWQTIPEELCKLMCDVEDRGPRHSNSSRYVYSFNGFGKYKDFQIGTARGCIQAYVLSKKKTKENFDVIKS